MVVVLMDPLCALARALQRPSSLFLAVGTAGSVEPADPTASSADRRLGSKVGGDQIVGGLAAAAVGLGRGRLDQVAIEVERRQNAAFVEAHGRLKVFERVGGDEKRALHGAVMSPEPHGAAGGVVEAHAIGKGQG